MDSEALVVPVPPMHRKPASRLPTGLYVIKLDEGLTLLIAETDLGYVGLPFRCPHDDRRFIQAGMVNPEKATIFCQAHCITYSLETGESVENLGAVGEDPGSLTLYEVERLGDEFIIRTIR